MTNTPKTGTLRHLVFTHIDSKTPQTIAELTASLIKKGHEVTISTIGSTLHQMKKSELCYSIKESNVTSWFKTDSLPTSSQTATPTLPTSPSLPIQPQPTLSIPHSITDAKQFELGDTLSQIMAIQQQNEMYRQGFTQIMNLFEQMGLLESDK